MLIVGLTGLALAFLAVRSRCSVVLALATVAVIVVRLILIVAVGVSSTTIVDVKEAETSGLGGCIDARGSLSSSTGVVTVDDDGFIRELVVDGG